MSILKRIFPFLAWFEKYDMQALRADFMSGLTVALVLVPQSMAYAQLAGLPAYYGLYAAFLPPIIASLFGSSRQLATGPVAIVSLMTSVSLEPLATAGSEQFVAYALLLALMIGVFQLSLGLLKLGVVVNFLSHPVVNGFTNAAALIIATSQLAKIFGVYVDKAPHHYQTIYRILSAAFHYIHWQTAAMAAIAFTTMIVLKRINKRIPQVLIAVTITTALSFFSGFEKNESIPVTRIESPEVVAHLTAFNTAVRIKEQFEAQRNEDKRLWKTRTATGEEVCGRCHGSRSLGDAGASKRAEPLPRAMESTILLHDLAGLFDTHIGHIKKTISEHRHALRQVLLDRGTRADGSVRFYVRGNAPADVQISGGTWRISVRDKAINPERVKLTGGGAVVGNIPEGLPALRMPEIDLNIVAELVAAAIIISLLGFMEAISIAKAMAARTRQKLNPNQELIGQGLANIVGCFGQSYAVSGSFSRSAVNFQTGGQTGLSNVFSSLFVMVVLLYLSQGLYHLPQAVLASVIMMAVVGLINVGGFVHAWRTSRFDGAVSIATFVITFFAAPHLEWGIGVGVVLSLSGYLYRTMRPKVISLAPHPDGAMMDIKRYGLKSCRYIAVVNVDGPLNFASINYLESEIVSRVLEFPELKHLLISGNGINEIDASGEEMLRDMVSNLSDTGCTISFSGFSDKVLDVLKRSHFCDLVGDSSFYRTRAQAIAAIYPAAHTGSEEEDCPYRLIMPPLVELSLHPDGSLRNAAHHQLRCCRHITVLRFDGPVTFANAAYMEQEILANLADRPTISHVLLVSHGINRIDASGAEKLGDLVTRLREDGYAVAFSGLKEEVVEVLEATHVTELIGHENLFPTQVVAVAGIYARAHMGSSEVACPLSALSHRLTELSLTEDGLLKGAKQLDLKLCRHIAVLRFDGPLPLSNQKASQSEFIRWAKKRPEVETIVFVGYTLDKIDTAEAENLSVLVAAVREAGYRVTLTGFSAHAFEALTRFGIVEAIGEASFYQSESLAIASVFTDAHAGSDEQACPFKKLMPKLVEVSKHSDGAYRDAARNRLALCRQIVAVRFDGSLNFATFRYFEKSLHEILSRRSSAKHILIAVHTLFGLDLAAAQALTQLFQELKEAGYWIGVSGLNDDDLEIFQKADPEGLLGSDAIFPTEAVAIGQIYARAHHNSDEAPCPLIDIVEAPNQT
jgi:sulfate permease, SulP family